MAAINQRQRRLPLGGAGRLADAAANRQAITVLHQGMPHVAKLGRLPVPLLVKPGFRVGRALVRLVGTLLLVEVALGVAAWTLAVVVASILPAEALERGPRLDQRAVHREVIARQQPLDLRLRQHRRQELGGDLSFQQPVAVLREDVE